MEFNELANGGKYISGFKIFQISWSNAEGLAIQTCSGRTLTNFEL